MLYWNSVHKWHTIQYKKKIVGLLLNLSLISIHSEQCQPNMGLHHNRYTGRCCVVRAALLSSACGQFEGGNFTRGQLQLGRSNNKYMTNDGLFCKSFKPNFQSFQLVISIIQSMHSKVRRRLPIQTLQRCWPTVWYGTICVRQSPAIWSVINVVTMNRMRAVGLALMQFSIWRTRMWMPIRQIQIFIPVSMRWQRIMCTMRSSRRKVMWI